MMKYIIKVQLLVTVLMGLTPNLTSGQDTRPNVLFILADDLGYADLGCMGSAYYETDNIDQLAHQGVRFTNAYAGSRVCSPSRATIMTGQFTARHGITDWIGAPAGTAWRSKNRMSQMLPAQYKMHMDKQTLTLPEAFRKSGYTTFFAGKWHLGGEGHTPKDHGFELNIGGFESGSPRGGYFDPFKNPELKNRQPGENLSLRLARETANFIHTAKTKPFFAFLSFYAVHGPIQTTQHKWAKYRDKAEKMGIAPDGFEMGDLLPVRKHQDNPVYAGLVETMDDAVGIVLKALAEAGLDKNTIIVFTSDNGGVVSGDNYSTNCAPLKGGKGYQWEGGIRVPLIVKVPGVSEAPKTCDAPVIASDFFPTLLDLAQLPQATSAHHDGKSIAPLLQGEPMEDRPFYWHYPHYGNQGGRPSSIIRLGNLKLIHFWEEDRDALYDLSTDIEEVDDLANQRPTEVKKLRTMLFDWLESVDANYPKADPMHNAVLEQKAVAERKIKLHKRLEAGREKMLQEDWQPNDTWWGSQPTKD